MNKWMKLSLRAKIFGSFFIVIVLSAGFLIVGFPVLRAFEREIMTFIPKVTYALELQNITRAYGNVEPMLDEYLVVGSKDHQIRLMQEVESVGDAIHRTICTEEYAAAEETHEIVNMLHAELLSLIDSYRNKESTYGINKKIIEVYRLYAVGKQTLEEVFLENAAHLKENSAEQVDHLKRVRERFLLIELMILTVGFFLALFLSYFLSTKIAYLEKITEKIADGDFSMKVSLEGDDEIAALAQSFEKMRERLKTSHEEIEAHNENLAKIVEARTQEIEKQNKELERTINILDEEIQSREKIQAELFLEKIFIEKILNTAQVIILVLDADGRIEQFNKYTEEVSGYRLEEVKGKDWIATFLPQSDHEKMHQVFLQSVHGIQKQGIVGPIITKGGSTRDIEWYNNALKDAQGNVTSVIAIGHDVTQRRKAAEEVARAENKFLEVLYASADAILLIDGTTFVDCNQSTMNMLGYESKEEFLHVHPSKLSPPLQPDGCSSRDKAEEMIHVALVDGFNRFDWIHTKANGTHFPVEVSLTPVAYKGKTIIHCLWRDMTQQKHAQKTKALLERELQQAHKLEAIGTLAAGVAHEINTPIQFIANNTGFLSKATSTLVQLVGSYRALLPQCEPGEQTADAIMRAQELEKKTKLAFLEEEIPRALSQTKEGADRVAKIVGAMKDFSHMGSEEMGIEDINKAIESTIVISKNEWKYVAEMKTALDPSLPMVKCFIGDIKQVVLNLIVNAAHAIEDVVKSTGSQGIITIATYQKDESVFITASDTGVGIPEEARERIFEHFFTTKEVGKGTGQGLSMAYQAITEKHKGQISFETEIGKGTTFIIQLPI